MKGEDARSLVVSEPTGPEALRIGSLSLSPASDDIVIDVHAAAVTFPDLLLTYGRDQVKPEPPCAPGREVAGVVRPAPAGASVAPGGTVAVFTGHGGGYAQTVAVPPHHVVPVPDTMDLVEAVGLLVNYQTAYFGLVARGRLRAGEIALVHGAGGGVGTAEVWIALGLDARVLVVVNDKGKAEIAREAGVQEVTKRTPGKGVDAVYDPLGGDGPCGREAQRVGRGGPRRPARRRGLCARRRRAGAEGPRGAQHRRQERAEVALR